MVAAVALYLQDHFAKYEPTILELKKKYEAVSKEKMLTSIDRDRLAAKVRKLRSVSSMAFAHDGIYVI